MDTLTLLRELSEHAEWADSIVFSAITGKTEAEGDEILLKRLRHLHLVQKVFLDVWRGMPINPEETASSGFPELMAYARSNHCENRDYLLSLQPEYLDTPTSLPWAELVSGSLGFQVADPTLGQTIMQVYAHSVYHRGQVNARLRELGVEPPMTDYIAWLWAYKPSPRWPGNAAGADAQGSSKEAAGR
ncbi:MAG: damage-inducible protein DinB [Chlorobiaceae bacterium]|nr:damage-inducible protein DinB [Chlorobiaceae bacterium]NTW09875.1 damage-inducible protein DinB [Chlorobiaceae bacterium]